MHHEWLRGLEFYQLELVILQERLEEIAGDNTGHEVSVQVEYFQNQLLIHRNYIDGLKHRIHENIKQMEQELKNGAGYVKASTAAGCDEVQDQYHTEEALVNGLRKEFNRFAAQWM